MPSPGAGGADGPVRPGWVRAAALPVGRSRWAVAAGYLGVLSLLAFPAPVAVAVGAVALRDLRRRPHLLGWARAVFAVVVGSVVSVLALLAWLTDR